ncbi:MAG: glycoside hydrolase family 97 protein [Candidatus Saccharibacteria bacterium]|nr:glycoside hydrolase family 97 protein [Candidatus Saccharibacteria bacterium]
MTISFLKSLLSHQPVLQHEQKILSPDSRIECVFKLRNGEAFYSVKKDGKLIVRDSCLGLNLQGEAPLKMNLSLVRHRENKVDESWECIVGEERLIRNNYNEAIFYLTETLKEKGAEPRLMTLRFRVFNEGVAFRYEVPPQPKFQRLIIKEELTEFNLDTNGGAWKIPAYQPDRYEYNYERTPIYNLVDAIHTPTAIETPDGFYVAIHEAALYNYGAMNLKLNIKGRLQADITPLSDGMKAYVSLPFNTPWRVLMIGNAPIELITNRMVLNLNDPPRDDFSWVRPIKFIGIWWAMFVGEWTWASGDRHGATTEHMIEYIDAARRLDIQGVLAEGWNNGWDGDWLQNGATTDFLHPMPDFDIEKVSQYAYEQGIEIVGHHETVGFVDNYELQLEEAYKYYTDHHINYIKSGYAGSRMTINGRKEFHHSQVGVNHYQKTVELAAKYHIHLDIHEPIKGTGIERTFPNLLTREGARGQEYEGGALSPSHCTIIPFTRLLAGGMDYTSGIFDITNGAKRLASTLARQVAYYVTIYSGMQMAADRPRFYEEVNPEVYEFIRNVPVIWERTVPLLGKIGEYYVVARLSRDQTTWFIGGVTNDQAHRVHLNLDFLEEAAIYYAEIYRDADNAHFRDNPLKIAIEAKRVTSSDFLDIWMAPGGGFAVRLRKL